LRSDAANGRSGAKGDPGTSVKRRDTADARQNATLYGRASCVVGSSKGLRVIPIRAALFAILYLVLKAGISGVIIMAVSEIAKRNPTFGALVASLPLVSLLAFLWLWRDTGDTARIADQAEATFW
jgi:hypothetical protein